jgi:hypothetical protein
MEFFCKIKTEMLIAQIILVIAVVGGLAFWQIYRLYGWSFNNAGLRLSPLMNCLQLNAGSMPCSTLSFKLVKYIHLKTFYAIRYYQKNACHAG